MKDGQILGVSYADDMKTHSVKLMPMIDDLFKVNNISVKELDLIHSHL